MSIIVLFSTVALADQFGELESIDAQIHGAPAFPGRVNPLSITKKGDLRGWAPTMFYEEKELEDGVKSFLVKWPEATASGFFPTSHCCTEVVFGKLVTSSAKWTFFGLRVGDPEERVLSVLGLRARREGSLIKSCGLNDCIVFTIENGHVSEIALLLYTG